MMIVRFDTTMVAIHGKWSMNFSSTILVHRIIVGMVGGASVLSCSNAWMHPYIHDVDVITATMLTDFDSLIYLFVCSFSFSPIPFYSRDLSMSICKEVRSEGKKSVALH
jgi:hypothetical protein